MPRTIAEKILSKAAGSVSAGGALAGGASAGRALAPGDFAWVQVDVVSLMDSVGFCDWGFLDRHRLPVWDPQRVLLSFDHFMLPQFGLGTAGLPSLRDWARRHGVPKENIFDLGRHGISHQIPVEQGQALPGKVYVGSDTQAATVGALNCFAIAALSATPYILATGETWLKVPESIRVELRGALPRGVLGKDIYLRLMQDLAGLAEGRVIEIGGEGLATMPLDVRLGVANGAPHLGATTIVFEPDALLDDYVRARARRAYELVEADAGADYAARFEYDMNDFEPLIAGPDTPQRVRGLGELAGSRIDAGYIGSCSSGRIADLRLAAGVLRGRKVHPNVRLVVTPISSEVMREATQEGLMAVFTEAGATVTTPGCGACFAGNQSPLWLDEGEVCLTSSVENWPGRMGHPEAKIYLANAAVVAAAAVAGEIVVPALAGESATPAPAETNGNGARA